MSKLVEFVWSWILKDRIQVKKRKKTIVALCLGPL